MYFHVYDALVVRGAQQTDAPLDGGHLRTLDSLRLLLALDRSRPLLPLHQKCRIAGIAHALILRRFLPPMSLQRTPDSVDGRREERFERSHRGLQLERC